MPKLFETLRERLLIAGVAPRHVRRYIAELEDHLADLRREAESDAAALARLGTLDDLARPMLEKPELRAWIARWPAATLVLGPIVATVVEFYALLAVFAAIVWCSLTFGWPAGFSVGHRGIEPMWFQYAAQAAVAALVFVSPVLIGWAASLLAIEQRLPPLWPIVGLALFALLSGTFDMQLIFPKVIGEGGELRLGFGWGVFGLLDPMPVSPWRWAANLILIVGPYAARSARRQRMIEALA